MSRHWAWPKRHQLPEVMNSSVLYSPVIAIAQVFTVFNIFAGKYIPLLVDNKYRFFSFE